MTNAAMVWMSAGNSFFTETAIQRTLQAVCPRVEHVVVLAPDEPAEHTYKALGYTGNDVVKKARLNANLLQNRARRVLETLPPADKVKCRVPEWVDEVMPHPAYQTAYQRMRELYRTHAGFAQDARQTTQTVLETKTEKPVAPDAVEEGVHYLLKELALVTASPEIFGVDHMTYAYHKEWPIFDKYIHGKYDRRTKTNLGFLLVP